MDSLQHNLNFVWLNTESTTKEPRGHYNDISLYCSPSIKHLIRPQISASHKLKIKIPASSKHQYPTNARYMGRKKVTAKAFNEIQ